MQHNIFVVSSNNESCNESGPYTVHGKTIDFSAAQEMARAEARAFAEKHGRGYRGVSFMVSAEIRPGVSSLPGWSCYVNEDGTMHEGGAFPLEAGRQLINLTPHGIKIYASQQPGEEDRIVADLPAAANPLRAEVMAVPAMFTLRVAEVEASGLPSGVVKLLDPPSYGKVTASPDDYLPNVTTPGEYGFIVSEIAARAILADPASPWRQHLILGPAELVRDSGGQPIGCRALTLWTDLRILLEVTK